MSSWSHMVPVAHKTCQLNDFPSAWERFLLTLGARVAYGLSPFT
jgi:hypothetical protein